MELQGNIKTLVHTGMYLTDEIEHDLELYILATGIVNKDPERVVIKPTRKFKRYVE